MKRLALAFTVAVVVAMLAVEGGSKVAYAEVVGSAASCTIGTAVLCKTVVEQKCTEWIASNVNLGVTGVGGGTTCGTWTTTTTYSYWSSIEAGGTPSPTKKLT